MVKTVIACVVTALLVGAGTASAAKLITGNDIKNGTIHARDLAPGVKAKLSNGGSVGPKGDTGATGPQGLKGDTGATGAAGAKGEKGEDGARGPIGPQGAKGDTGAPGLSEVEADGPYPGGTDLGALEGQGDNSDATWATNGRQTSWVQCAPGKVAVGGGFHLAADAGDAAAKAVQVVVSEPAQVKNGNLVYEEIPGDAAGSFRPNGWVVQGFNDGDSDVVVRPWAVCAKVAS